MTRRRAPTAGCDSLGGARAPLWSSLGVHQPGLGERRLLARADFRDTEVLDRLVEQPVIVELGGKMQEYAAETDRCAVHEHELARHPDGTLLLERPVHLEGLTATVFGRLDAVRDRALAVV